MIIIIISFMYYFSKKIISIFSCSGMFQNVPFSWFNRQPLKVRKFRENRKSNEKFYCNKNNTVTNITRITIPTKFAKVQTYKDERQRRFSRSLQISQKSQK